MKVKLLLLHSLLLCCLLLNACSEDDHEENGPAGTITAQINGQDWKAVRVSAAYNEAYQDLLIGGESASGEGISLAIDNVTGTGTFTGNSSGIVVGTYLSGNSNEQWSSFLNGDCLINVTKFDKSSRTISGTFEFVGENDSQTSTKTITGGKFTDVRFEPF
ncbi:DUF6252 family protein [Rufibacter ruber]|uniref:DUF6252 family protein n=1 Tax=Rufibacter ruber TaxID=1783499 RepID=UPI0012905518|nr:DUF6252 family protein [Rufibacter ruber]